MITILTDKATNNLGQDMYQKIIEIRQDVKHFSMENMRIEPCYACRGCDEKAYKRCIIRDDADQILPYLARSKTIAVFTSIVFGGYSFHIKRIADRFALLLPKGYNYRDGELVAGKYPGINYHVIGIHDGIYKPEIEIFKQLVMENHKITGWVGQSLVLPYDEDKYNSLIKEVAKT